MPAAPYGAFGSANYPNLAIPRSLVVQYPGALSLRNAIRGYGQLGFGPAAKGMGDVAAAQSEDPEAEQYQTGTQQAGGLPGAGTGLYGSLVSGMMKGEPLKQQVTDKQIADSLSGIADVGTTLAGNISGLQRADLQRQLDEAEAAGSEMGGYMSLLDLFTNPRGMGGNIMSGMGMSGGSPFGGLYGALSGLLGSGAGAGAAGAGFIPELGVPAGADLFGMAGLAAMA